MRKFIVKEYCPMKEDMVVAGKFEWDMETGEVTHKTSALSQPYPETCHSSDDVRKFIYNVMKTDDNLINITEVTPSDDWSDADGHHGS